jgi:hypothetical protein
MSDFNYLPFNKNFGYKSPISDDNICRTGTVKNDCISSFLNAVLYGCSINFNILKSEEEKIEKIKELKEIILNKIKDSDEFKNYLLNVKEKFVENLNMICDYIENQFNESNEQESNEEESNEKGSNEEESNEEDVNIVDSYSFSSEINSNIQLYKVIIDLVNIDDYTKILKKTIRNSDNNFESFRHNLMVETMKFIDYEDLLEDVDEERVKYIKKNVCYFLDLALNDIDVKEPQIPDVVTPEIIKLTSKQFENCDIYFVDWDTKLPKLIEGYKPSNINTSIIILSFNDNDHFEIIGKTVNVDSDTKKHKIKRDFKPFDDIIKSINFYLDKKDRS